MKLVIARIAVKTLKPLMERAIMPILQWSSRQIHPKTQAVCGDYIEGDYRISETAVRKALEYIAIWERERKNENQAVLNSFLEGLRGPQLLSFSSMFGALIGRYPADEAFARVLANAVMLGAAVEFTSHVIPRAGEADRGLEGAQV